MRKTYSFLMTATLIAVAYGALHASAVTQFSYSTESFTGLTSSLSPTTIFTPSVDGNYRVGVAVEFVSPCCTNTDGSNVGTYLNWSDNTNSYSVYGGNFSGFVGLGGAGNGTEFVIRAKAGSPVKVSTNASCSGCTLDTYNVFVTVIGN